MPKSLKFDNDTILKALSVGLEAAYNENKEEPVAKDYINPTAATLLDIAGYPVTYQDGTLVEKTAFGNYTRNNLVTGIRAREVLKLVFDQSEILRQFTWITGDELTIPIDVYRGLVEQLISTERAGAQLTAGEETDLLYIMGTELYCRNMERQYDIPIKDLYNNLYRPGFEKDIELIINTEIANDFAKVFTSGYTDTHVKGSFYTLQVGYEEILQSACGTWTNSQSVTAVYGKYGQFVTPNKIDINKVINRVAYTNDFTVSADGFTIVSGATASIASTFLADMLEVVAVTTGYVKRATPIKVHAKTYYTLAFSADGDHSTASGYAKVIDEAGNTLAESNVHLGVALTDYTMDFYTGDSGIINIYFYSTVNTKTVGFGDCTITKASADLDGYDVIDILIALKKSARKEYRTRKDMVYLIAPEDVDSYADCRASAVYVKDGQYVGTNTTVRDQWTTDGVIPNFKGHRFVVNPVKPSINELTPKDIANSTEVKGTIIFGPLKEIYIGGKNFINTYRNPTGRLRTGGAGIENTKHWYVDINVRNKMAFSDAFRDAKCETVVLMSGKTKNSAAVISGTTTAAAGCYPYCDTSGSVIYYTLTNNVADLATYALAKAGVTTGDVFKVTEDTLVSSAESLTAAEWSFRAFKDVVLQPSTISASTFI